MANGQRHVGPRIPDLTDGLDAGVRVSLLSPEEVARKKSVPHIRRTLLFLAWLFAHHFDTVRGGYGLSQAPDSVGRPDQFGLVRLGEPGMGLWPLPEPYVAAQAEVLAVLPKPPAALLSLEKGNVRRWENPPKGRPVQ